MKNYLEFNELPQDVQDKLKKTLRAFSEETVTYENGKYEFGLCIKAHYAPDHKYIGTYYAKDIFTEEERILNYVNEFHSYPISYKGKRDYSILEDRKATYKLVDGNIVLA